MGYVEELGGEDDRHDDTVDGDNFAEDDRYQILRPDSGRLHASADDRGASDEYSPVKKTTSC